MARHDSIPSGNGAFTAVGMTMAGLLMAVAGSRRYRPGYDLQGRVVLVTGGSRGLGYQLAREFGRRGARLVLLARSEDDLAEAAARLWSRGVDVHVQPCDVRDPAAVAQAVDRAVAWGGRLDVLVNNAGVITVAPLENTATADYVQSIATHFWGAYHCVQACLPHLRRVHGARIVNVSSIGGRVGVPHLAAYSAGKFALVGWSRALGAALSREGIRVTTVTPGLMRTGSHVRAHVRGHHAREARWFAAGVLTPLTSMNAARAARQVVAACVAGRATVSPGWQARVAEMLEGMAPRLVALGAAVATGLLPPPSDTLQGRESRCAGDVGFGWMDPLLPRDPIDERQDVGRE